MPLTQNRYFVTKSFLALKPLNLQSDSSFLAANPSINQFFNKNSSFVATKRYFATNFIMKTLIKIAFAFRHNFFYLDTFE